MAALIHTRASLVTPPASEPVSVADVKAHARITETAEDALIGNWITAARQHLESTIGRAFITQTWDVYYDTFAEALLLPYSPLGAITTVTYYDAAGTQQTLSTSVYEAVELWHVARVREKYGQYFPTTRGGNDDVTVRYTCGFGATAASVPAPLKQALTLLAAEFYRAREPLGEYTVPQAELPYAIRALVMPYRCFGYS